MTSPYDVGARLAKLALFERPDALNPYPAAPQAAAPMDPQASSYYDILRDFVKQRKIEQSFDMFDRRTGFSDDNRTDISGSPGGGGEP